MKIALLAMLMATTLAAQTPAPPPADASGDRSATHLRVEVETKYAWIYQKSGARVWATVSKDDT